MDVHLLDKALNCYGSSLLHQLEAEHGDAAVIPVALRRKYSGIATVNKDFWSSEDKENGEFKAAVEKFIAKKADLLFESKHHRSVTKDVLEENPEDVYGILAPLESFMHVPPDLCHQHFYESLSVDDVVIGVVVSVMETGLVARLLCVDSPSIDRDIDELDITAFCPSKELPRMFTHQSVTEAYQPRDIVRGIVLSINPEKEKIILSLRDKSDVAEKEILPKIGLISKDDFPVHYRRKLQKNEMSFNQLLHSILGFTNKGSVDFLRSSLGLSNTSSLMRGLHRLKIPEEEYADKLRKWQAQKQARWSVEQGVEMVKKGRQLEAIQHLNRALQLDPDNTEALVARGAVYANNECYPKAVEDFERALEADPKHSNARKYLLETRLAFGRSHEERDQLEEAEDDYKEALKLNPQSSEARDGLERVKHLQAKDKSKKGKHSPVIVISTSGSSDEDDKLQRATETLKRLIHADDKDNRKAKTKVGSRSRSRKKSRKHSRRKSRHKKSYMSSSSSSETDSSSSPNSEIQKKQKQHYTRCPVDDSPDSLESEQERKSNSRGKDRQLTSGPLHREKIQIEGKHLTSRPQKQQSRVKEKELLSDSSLSDASSRDRHSRSRSKKSRRRSQSHSQSQHVTTEGSTGWTSPRKSKGSNFSKSAYQNKLGKLKRHSSSSSDSSSHLGRQSSSSSSSSTSDSSQSSDSSDERHTRHRRVSLETVSSEKSSRSNKRSVWIEKTAHNKDTQKHGAEKPRRLPSGSQNQPTRPSKDTKEEGMETCGSPHSMKSVEGEVKHPLRSQRENKIQECGATSSHDGGASEVQDHHCQHDDEDATLVYSRLVALQDGHNQKNDELAEKQTKASSMTCEDTESRYKTSLKEIVTKKGVPTVVSKWDSPVRRSRWDIAEQDKLRRGGIKVEEMSIMSLQENDVPANPSLPVPQESQSMMSKSLGDYNRINDEKKKQEERKQNTDLQDEEADSRARKGSDEAQVGPPDAEPQKFMNRRQSILVPGQGGASTSDQNNGADDKNESRLGRQKPLPAAPCTIAHNSRKDSERDDNKYSRRSLSREREQYSSWPSQMGKNTEESFTHKSSKHVYRSLSSSEDWRQSRSPSAESKSSGKKIQYTPNSERSSSRNHTQREGKLSQQEEAMWVEKTTRNDAVWVEKTSSNKTKSDTKGKQRLHTLGVAASSIHDSDPKDSKAQQKSQKTGKKRKRSRSDSSSDSSSDTKKKARSSNKKFKRAKHFSAKKKHKSSSPVTKKVMMTSSRKSFEGTYKQDWNVDPSKLKIKHEPQMVGEQSSFKDEDSKKIKWTKEEDIQLNQLETFLKALKTKKTEQLLAEGKLKKV